MIFLYFRAQRARQQMSKGPNKIVLLPEDLMFVMPKGSIFTSKVCRIYPIDYTRAYFPSCSSRLI